MPPFERIEFEYEGDIRPYTRMTQASQHVNRAAIAYLKSRNELRDWLAWETLLMIREDIESYEYKTISKKGEAKIETSIQVLIPPKTSLGMSITFINQARGYGCDLDNLVKTVMDASNRIVFADDRYVDMIVAERFIKLDVPMALTKIAYYPIGE